MRTTSARCSPECLGRKVLGQGFAEGLKFSLHSFQETYYLDTFNLQLLDGGDVPDRCHEILGYPINTALRENTDVMHGRRVATAIAVALPVVLVVFEGDPTIISPLLHHILKPYDSNCERQFYFLGGPISKQRSRKARVVITPELSLIGRHHNNSGGSSRQRRKR